MCINQPWVIKAINWYPIRGKRMISPNQNLTFFCRTLPEDDKKPRNFYGKYITMTFSLSTKILSMELNYRNYSPNSLNSSSIVRIIAMLNRRNITVSMISTLKNETVLLYSLQHQFIGSGSNGVTVTNKAVISLQMHSHHNAILDRNSGNYSVKDKYAFIG